MLQIFRCCLLGIFPHLPLKSMNYYAFRKTHVHRAALLVAFYGFALSLLNSKSIVAIVYNIASFLSMHNDEEADANSLVNISRRVYYLFAQSVPESRGLAYLDTFLAGICCLMLAYGNRELRPSYYWPFIAFSLYKMMYCSSEVLEATMIILHKMQRLPVDQQASTIHLVMFVGVCSIVMLFVWAWFMDIVYRARCFMEKELLDPLTGLSRLHGTLLAGVQIQPPPPQSAETTSRPANNSSQQLGEIPPPHFGWKPGDPINQQPTAAPAYRP